VTTRFAVITKRARDESAQVSGALARAPLLLDPGWILGESYRDKHRLDPDRPPPSTSKSRGKRS